MIQPNSDFITISAINALQKNVREAMSVAHQKVMTQRAKEAAILADQHRAAAEKAVDRASEIIANIPQIIGSRTEWFLEHPNRSNGFDACGELMELDSVETPQYPGSDHRTEPKLPAPDPKQLCYAARLVWDFCEASGYNPQLIRGTGYHEQYESPGSSYSYACFKILIRWNIPADITAA